MSDRRIDKAIEMLERGGLVALPTETVYGLGADAENELAVRKIFAVKGRPSTHPLIVHVADWAAAKSWVNQVPEQAETLAQAFWPGPLTLVLPKSSRACEAVTGGQETVALRVPAHPLAQELLGRWGRGIAAPSANRFGSISPTTAEHVRQDLREQVDFILDGGPCAIGIESTIIDLSSPQVAILRLGGIAKSDIERVLGMSVPMAQEGTVRAPGMLRSHYAPKAGVVLVQAGSCEEQAQQLLEQGQRVAVMAFANETLPEGVTRFDVPADEQQWARELYATLRRIDESGFDVIVAVLPHAEGLSAAIRDRLTRAAAPRVRDD